MNTNKNQPTHQKRVQGQHYYAILKVHHLFRRSPTTGLHVSIFM